MIRTNKFLKLTGISLLLGGVVLASGCGQVASEKALEEGAVLEKNGKLAAAMAEYNRAAELSPDNTNAYYYRAMLYQKQGNLDASLADYNKIIELKPDYSDPYYGRGTIYDSKGQRDKAIAEYTKALENNVNNTLAYFKRAKAYEAKGEYRKALDDARKAKGLGAAVKDDILRELEAGAAGR